MDEPDNDQKSGRRWLTQWVPGIVLWILIGAILAGAIFAQPCQGRELPYSARCAANLSFIGKCIFLYRREHNNLPPPNLAALAADGNPTAIFKCPSTDTEKATTTQPADIAAHCDYIYAPPSADIEEGKKLVMAFELPDNHKDLVNVLFNDYSVQGIQDMDRFVSVVQELNDYHAGLRKPKP